MMRAAHVVKTRCFEGRLSSGAPTASPLRQVERTEVRGFIGTLELALNPHPTLSLGKGEAKRGYEPET
jgi:hypothetical protein